MERFLYWIGCAALAAAMPAFGQIALAPTKQEAARFLTQATFGPTGSDINNLSNSLNVQGYSQWLDSQFSANPSLHRPQLEGAGFVLTAATQADRQEVWWRYAVTAPDQLRQRVAFALSEILVTSDVNSQLNDLPLVLAEYYDILVRDAFGNYRQLLQDVTLSPAMGIYLSHLRNDKPDPATGRRPDENFAREAMQLFSIGLRQLNLDGSFKLDTNNQPIPTYDQNTIENFARVYTGWTWADSSNFYASGKSYAPMKAYEDHHDTNAKTLLNGLSVAAGQTAAQDLKAALDNIFNHPNVAPFISRRLIQKLVTSNPSPAYIQRVAQVFENNGSGVRGDLKAVVRAILLDSEARALPSGSFGKLREPVLRLTAVWRAFNASASNSKYAYPNPERDWGQAALRSPSVFNFFSPDYKAPGEIAKANLNSPEFQLQTESPSMVMINAMTHFVRNGYQGAAGTNSSSVLINISNEKSLAANPTNLADSLNLSLMEGQMSSNMRTALINYLNTVPAGDGTQRAVDAIFLVATSPEFSVQK